MVRCHSTTLAQRSGATLMWAMHCFPRDCQLVSSRIFHNSEAATVLQPNYVSWACRSPASVSHSAKVRLTTHSVVFRCLSMCKRPLNRDTLLRMHASCFTRSPS